MVRRVQIQGLLQVSVCQVDLACLHARSRPVHIVLWIVREEVNCSAELDLGTLIILLVEALSSKGVVRQR